MIGSEWSRVHTRLGGRKLRLIDIETPNRVEAKLNICIYLEGLQSTV